MAASSKKSTRKWNGLSTTGIGRNANPSLIGMGVPNIGIRIAAMAVATALVAMIVATGINRSKSFFYRDIILIL